MPVTARQNATQQVHFIRRDFAFNTANATGIQVSMGAAIPAGAVVTDIVSSVQTVFNAATTNTLAVGTGAAPTALLAAGALGAVASTRTQPATLGGLLSSTVDTELFIQYNFTGTAPTTGAGTVIVFYVPNT